MKDLLQRFRAKSIWIVSVLLLLCHINFTSACMPVRRVLATSSEISTCLRPAQAKVVLPGNSDYEAARGHVFNHRFLYEPAAFVFVTTVSQVQNAVTCAVQLKIGIAPRSGGHSYEDYSLGGRDGVLVVDLGGMNKTVLNKTTGLATVGAGARLGPMKLALWNQGKVSTPSGTCPSVGVGGHSLGGGWGFLSRKFGIMSDSIVEAQVVTATGSVVITNSRTNPDLLFALRGAGANCYGIVTQFTFKTYDVSRKVTQFRYTFNRTLFANTTKAYQTWGLTVTSDVSASLYHDKGGSNLIHGIYLGPKSNIKTIMRPFLSNLPAPLTTEETEVDYITSVLTNAGFQATDSISVLDLKNYTYPTATFKSKSIFVKKSGFSDAGIQAYVQAMEAGASSSYCIFDLFGGSGSAINKIAPNASAWMHRDALFSIQMFTYWQHRPSQATAGINWIENLWSKVRPFSSPEAYQNYIDRNMTLYSYYGSNLSRLKTVKKKWDPLNVFNFQQSIPVR